MSIINIVYSLVIISNIINSVYGGYPISDPNAATIDGKTQPYNLIDTDPSCFHEGICPMFPPGGELSAFPNSEEKFQQLLHNLHRMHSNESLGTPLGHWFYGANELGGETYFCNQGCDYCGTTHPDRKPLYWYSDANQMARFKQWDENTCDQSWYNEPGEDAHSTCGWANTSLPEWRGFTNGVLSKTYGGNTYKTGTNRCALFGVTPNLASTPNNPTPFNDDCQFAGRAGKFCHDEKDRCWFETEGICGGNTCLFDPHCEPIFANKYDYVGKGFVAKMNGVGHVYSRYTKEIYYLLPIGVHYDERWKIHPDDHDSSGKYFVLMLEYFDKNKTQTPTNCYALYDGQYTSMSVYVSSMNDHSVIFDANYLPPSACKPYAFICKTSQGNFYRLPEEETYYFGTEWIDWVWSDFETEYGYNCKENHYYKHATDGWTVNGGPTLTKSDIWYYQDTVNYGSCIGCDDISVLECWEDCIRSDFNSLNCSCSQQTTPSPTYSGQTCDGVYWSYRWSRVSSWNEGSLAPTYREVAEELFIEEHTECGTYNSEIMEYYYYFAWWGLTGPNKKKLDIHLYVCCGETSTFGPNFKLPDDLTNKDEYNPNDVLINRYGDETYEDEWTDPSKFGAKQYIVFSISGAIFLCFCVVIIYIAKKYKHYKQKNKQIGKKTTEMHGMSLPGPKHVQFTSNGGIESSDGSTDGSNKYQAQFIHSRHKDSSDSQNGFNTNLSPPIQLMGHAVVPSQSVDDTPELNDVNVVIDDDNNNNNNNINNNNDIKIKQESSSIINTNQ